MRSYRNQVFSCDFDIDKFKKTPIGLCSVKSLMNAVLVRSLKNTG